MPLHFDSLQAPDHLPILLKEKRVTCINLDNLNQELARTSRELRFLTQDISRQVTYGKKINCFLDFSELFTFLWPDQSRSRNKALIRYLLTESSIQFILPPGSILELLRKLSEKQEKLQQDKSRMAEFLKGRLASELLSAYFRATRKGLPPDLENLGQSSFSNVLSQLQNLHKESRVLEDLNWLLQSKRVRPLSEEVLGKQTDSMRFDPEIYQEAYSQLTSYGANRDANVNVIDAHNYALTYYLNNNSYNSSNSFFLLITSSPVPLRVFENIKWKEDPEYARTALRTSLVRHPLHLFYYDKFLKTKRNDSSRLIGWRQHVEKLLHRWQAIPTYADYCRGNRSPNEMVTLPELEGEYLDSLRAFKEFYDEALRPRGELLCTDISQEQNKRRLRGISLEDIGTSALPPPDHGTSLDQRTILLLFDQLMADTEAQITQLKFSLKVLDEKTLKTADPAHVASQLSELVMEKRPNQDLQRVEGTIVLRPRSSSEANLREEVVWVDIYSDYASFLWPTNVTFTEFVRAMRYAIKAISQWTTQMNSQVRGVREKEYLGLYFYLEDGLRFVPLAELEELTAEGILSHCQDPWRIRSFRFGHEMGDFCYDFVPDRGSQQQISFLSHLFRSKKTISEFIWWTHTKHVSPVELEKIFSSLLSE